MRDVVWVDRLCGWRVNQRCDLEWIARAADRASDPEVVAHWDRDPCGAATAFYGWCEKNVAAHIGIWPIELGWEYTKETVV